MSKIILLAVNLPVTTHVPEFIDSLLGTGTVNSVELLGTIKPNVSSVLHEGTIKTHVNLTFTPDQTR